MAGKKRLSSKKIQKRIESYQRVIDEHQAKVTENLETGKRPESIPAMKREIKAAEDSIAKLEKTKEKRRKRGS